MRCAAVPLGQRCVSTCASTVLAVSAAAANKTNRRAFICISSREYDCAPPGFEGPQHPPFNPCAGYCRQHFPGGRGWTNNHHSYTHVERSVHLCRVNIPRFHKDPKNVRHPPTLELDDGVEALGQRAIEVLRQSTTRDVGHRMNPIEHRLERRE